MTAQTASARVQAVSPHLHPRSQHTATLLPNGEVLVVGGSYGVALSATGQNQPKQSLATIREFHTGTKQWATVGQLGAPRNGHTVTCLADDTILVVGGADRSNGSSEPTVERIDLGTP